MVMLGCLQNSVSVIIEAVLLFCDDAYVLREKTLMKTMERTLSCTARKSPHSTTIHTTLYDLIAALSAAVESDEEDVLTATVVHLLNTHRVTCTGNLQGYR